VIEQHNVIFFAAAYGGFVFQQLKAADAAVRGGDRKSRHGRYSPFILSQGDQGDGGVVSSACQALPLSIFSREVTTKFVLKGLPQPVPIPIPSAVDGEPEL